MNCDLRIKAAIRAATMGIRFQSMPVENGIYPRRRRSVCARDANRRVRARAKATKNNNTYNTRDNNTAPSLVFLFYFFIIRSPVRNMIPCASYNTV